MSKENIKKVLPPVNHKVRELEQDVEIKNGYITALEEQNNEPYENSTDHWHKEREQENQMFKELIENLEAKTSSDMGQLFSMISHELKTPLVPIQTYVKMLKEERFGNLNEIQKEKLGIVYSNSIALGKLIQSMLDYQKLSSGSMGTKGVFSSCEIILNNCPISEDVFASRFSINSLNI